MIQTIGKRIAQLRTDRGWTQQYLADRTAISRVAVSHIEMDLTIPGERTITLMAGMFKMTPHELVVDTTYPIAKSDRLPLTACCFTPLENDLALLENDLKWLKLIQKTPLFKNIKGRVYNHWSQILSEWDTQTIDPYEIVIIREARLSLKKLIFSET